MSTPKIIFPKGSKHVIINKEGCKVWYIRDYLTEKEADDLFDHCETLEWIQHQVQVFGKMFDQPRLSMSMGYAYHYAKNTHPKSEWTSEITSLLDKINKILNLKCNSCLLNYYRDGNDNVGAHSDSETPLKENKKHGIIVVTITLGCSRRFILQHKESKEKVECKPSHGTLLVMEGDTQKLWKHQIPKEKKIKGPRISLTFREFKSSGRSIK